MVPVKLLLWDLHGINHASNPVLHPIMFRRKAAIIFVADLETQQLCFRFMRTGFRNVHYVS